MCLANNNCTGGISPVVKYTKMTMFNGRQSFLACEKCGSFLGKGSLL